MSDREKYTGVVVPMISPFLPDGTIDAPAARRVVDRLVSGGVAGVFPLGTTGERASMTASQRLRLMEIVAEHLGDRSMLYAGIAGNCLSDSIDAARAYAKLGATAVVAHPPSYYPLGDAEMLAYFLRLADAAPVPLVLYNIPITTHHAISIPVVMTLAEHPNIVALKDSAGDEKRLTELLRATGGRGGFPVLLGSSAWFTHGLKAGGVGLVPSGAHLLPREYQQMYEAAMRDDWAEVERLQQVTDRTVARYIKGRSLGQGLAALKAILESQGICGRTMLPPIRDHMGAAP